MSEKNEWKLVPVVPTDDMEAAAEDDYEQTGATFPRWKSAYAAMLAAAPSAPGDAQDEQRVAVPDDVMAALDRMCTPLHPTQLSGATASADAFCMQLIRDYILRRPACAPAAGDALDAMRYRLLRMFALTGAVWPFNDINAPAGLIAWSCGLDDRHVVTQLELDRMLDDMLGLVPGAPGTRADYQEWRAAETKARIGAALAAQVPQQGEA